MVRIPRRLDEILPAAAMERILDVLQQPDISNKVREAMNKVGLRDSTPLNKVKDAWQQARTWLDSLVESGAGGADNPTTLNATGQLFNSKFAGAPVAPSVAYGYAKAAANYQQTGPLEVKTELALANVFKGRPSAWLNSTAEALRLLTSSKSGRDGVVISRADSVRIPALGDVRAMLAQGTNPLVELGAANGVSAEDWASGLTSSNQILVLCSPNNLELADAVKHRDEALRAAKACGAKVIELLADAVLCQPLVEAYGFSDPNARLASGTNLVVLPLHLLLGGPSGALIVGDAELLNPAIRTAETTGSLLSGAALTAATIAIQIGSLVDELELGVAAQLLANQENLKNRARRIAVQLSGVGEVGEALEIGHSTLLGRAPWNRYRIDGWAVRVNPKSSLEELLQQLEQRGVAQGIHIEAIREPNSLLLDLRFISPENDHEIVLAFTGKIEENQVSSSHDLHE